MQHDRVSGSPSRIPGFSPTPAESVPSPACLKPCDSNACPDIVRQLLDELISAAALQAAGGQHTTTLNASQLLKGSSYDDSSRASGARRSAITALREGIDARCDEPASIEAMEALDSTADDSLLVPSPFKSVPQHKGSTLQVGCNQNSNTSNTILMSTDRANRSSLGPWQFPSSSLCGLQGFSCLAESPGHSSGALALHVRLLQSCPIQHHTSQAPQHPTPPCCMWLHLLLDCAGAD